MESAYYAERIGGQQFRGWTPAVYAQAATVNVLRGIQHMYLLSHLDKRASKPKPPNPFPTPEVTKDKPKKPQNAFARTAGAMLAASRRRKAGG